MSYARNTETNEIAVLDRNDYYPFGMNFVVSQKPKFSPKSGWENYKYNGKELQETGMYDYGARFYMADIGRWGVVDPLAEKYPNVSHFAYCLNNPLIWTDSTGMTVEPGSQKEWDKQKQSVTAERDRLQGKIDRLNAKASEKGWSAKKLAERLGICKRGLMV